MRAEALVGVPELSHELLAGLIESMGDGVSVLNVDGTHALVNRAFCEMTGFSRETLLGGRPPHPYWPPEHLPEILAAFEEMRANGGAPFSLTFCRKDGSRFPALITASEHFTEEGGFYIGIVKDLSAQRAQQAHLEKLQGLIEVMLKGGDLGTWEWDVVGGGISLSDSFCAILGHEPGALDDREVLWEALLHPDDVEMAGQQMQALLAGRARLYDVEHRLRDAEGRWRWILARGYITAYSHDGAPCRVAGTAQDIHRLKIQEQRLRQFQKMEVLGQLTGGIAHDFNNLLAILQMSLEQIREDAVPEQELALDTAQAALKRGASLTGSLLRYARREEGTPQVLDVCDFIQRLQGVLKAATTGPVALSVELSEGPCSVRCDPSALENAILSLLVNARDALMPEGGAIVLSVSLRTVALAEAMRRDVAAGDYVSISVRDDGRGMSPEVLRRATEPLFSTKPMGKGTGLGLSMVSQLANSTEGFLDLTSTEGAGTCAALLLPMSLQVPAASAPERRDLPRGSEVVLVVDDEVVLLQGLASELRSLGYTIIVAADPRRALAALRQQPVDLLLTDIVMPYSINGVELAKRARVLSPSLPILFMTGFAAAEEASAAEEMGALLKKPFTTQQLAVRLRETLDTNDTGDTGDTGDTDDTDDTDDTGD